MKSLIIVESFTKTKTIKKYLNDQDCVVTCSLGHIFNLPKDKLGINTDDWSVEYIQTNKKIISTIRKYTKDADIIYLASDPDLEGEAIANHIKMAIKDLLKNKMCYRITFNEISKTAILDAIEHPRNIDDDKVQAQETRRIVDRLIGYKISPLIWAHFNQNHLSAGRVQIAGLVTCINQRNKILNKEIIPYWIIEGKFKIHDLKITAQLYDAHNKTIRKFDNSSTVKHILQQLEINTLYKISYDKRLRKVSPLPPYTTTSLQQDAYNKCRFNAKVTMKLAQDLYENGLITYMRTDATYIADDAKHMIVNYIKKEFGAEYAKYRTYKTKIANAQEAHEAIRITKPDLKDSEITFEGYTQRHGKLYDIIRRRTLACLMVDAEYADIVIELNEKDHLFSCTKSFLEKEGFRKVYDEQKEDYSKFLKTLDKYDCRSIEYTSDGSVDNIPSMYNEVQLIKELEKEGIGRPSTYATIIDKLLEKKYVILGQNPQQSYDIECFVKGEELQSRIKQINLGGKQKDLLIPTDLGLDIIKYLFDVTPYLCDLKFTAKMEDDLDAIMSKQNTKEAILNGLHAQIVNSCNSISANLASSAPSQKSKERQTGITQTRYGYCYYHKNDNRYTNIEPYLKWKNISVDMLSDDDIQFLKSLPKEVTYKDKSYQLHIGKFGLYLKDDAGGNHKLDKRLWATYAQ